MQQAISAAQRKIDAIDKRINAVRAELYRIAGIDLDAFDYDTKDGQMAACIAHGNARRDVPGYAGLETSLFIRRADAADLRDGLIFKAARAAERREARQYRKQIMRQTCPTCGQLALAS